jgi:hypothetical protein
MKQAVYWLAQQSARKRVATTRKSCCEARPEATDTATDTGNVLEMEARVVNA